MIARGEPKTIRDVWYMIKTSNAIHMCYKNLVPFDRMEVGDKIERFIDVEVDYFLTTISVVEYESECASVNREKHGYSSFSVEISRKAYNDIDGFKNSPYYNDFLMAFGDGSPDASWHDDVHITRNEAEGEIRIECEMGDPRYDGLNSRYRLSKSHSPLSVVLNPHYGTIEIESEDDYYEFDTRKLKEMMDTFKMLKENGIVIDKYAGIKIPWKVED